MSERALRGTRLGATSYETDSGIDLAPRQDVEYGCPNGHRFEMPLALEADVPPTWECRVCGAQALRVDGEVPEEKPGKPARTHWDMLLERRSVADLEEVLAERLEVLRTGGISYARAMAPTPGQSAAAAAGAAGQGQQAPKSHGRPQATATTTALIDANGVPTAAAIRPLGGAAPKAVPAKTAPTKKAAPGSKAPATKTVGRPVKKAPAAKPATKK
jgi:rubredoxin